MSWTHVILASLIAILFSGDQISRKLSLDQIHPLQYGAISFFLAALLSFFFLLFKKESPFKKSLKIQIWPGVLYYLCNISMLMGVRNSMPGRASVIIAANPIFVALFAQCSKDKEPISKYQFLGFLLAFAGVFLVFAEPMIASLQSNQSLLLGDGLLLLGAAIMGYMILHIKKVTLLSSSEKMLFWQMLISGFLFYMTWLVLSFFGSFLWSSAGSLTLDGGSLGRVVWVGLTDFHKKTWVGIFYQAAVIAGIGALMRAKLVARFGASRIAAYFFITPVSAVVLSHFYFQEPVNLNLLFGGLTVLSGVYLINRNSSNKFAATTRL